MNIQIQNILHSPKSSIKAACGLAIAIILAVMALPAPASRWVIALAVLRSVVGFLEKDAGTTTAVVPGLSAVQVVPSHETPDDPTARPVA